MTEQTIKIEGMTCGGCVAGVKGALDRVGVEKKEVEIGSATIHFDEEKISLDQIVEAIEDAGYDVIAN